MNYQIIKISEQPNWILKAALWFSKKWKIKKEEYQKSMLESVNSPIPEWYVLLDSNQTILAGAGVIENDFHPYHEFCPNLCALYVQKKYRNQKLATHLIQFIIKDMQQKGIKQLFLLTNHSMNNQHKSYLQRFVLNYTQDLKLPSYLHYNISIFLLYHLSNHIYKL